MLSPEEAKALKPWIVGRFRVNATPGTTLRRQTQYLDGTVFTFDPVGKYPSLDAALSARSQELGKNQYAPVVGTVRWDPNSGAVMYVKDVSDPEYLELEGRRWIAGRMLVAVTSGDKKLVPAMEVNVRRMLNSYVPGDLSAGADHIFGMEGGTLNLPFVNNEEAFAYLAVPELAAKLDFGETVVAKPDPVQLWDRAEKTRTIAKQDGVAIETVRKQKVTVAGQEGQEFVSSAVEHGATLFDARFESAGEANSPTKPKLVIHMQTDASLGSLPTRDRFLAFWDTFLSTAHVN